MGGIGSGRRRGGGSKDVAEDSQPLDIRRLDRSRLLLPGRWFEWQWTVYDRPVASIQVRVEADHVTLVYRHRRRGGSEWMDVQQSVRIGRTSCHYGGTRPWWLCPSCSRRVAVLYCARSLFACRHCYRLAYACQRETADDRAARHADRIRRRLGWKPGILNGAGDKPKGMHWRTLERLLAKHDAFVGESLAGMARRLDLLKKWVG